jgi:trk system potassium uptake protein TrkH
MRDLRREVRYGLERVGFDRYRLLDQIARRKSTIANIFGLLSCYMSISFLLPLATAYWYGEDLRPWIYSFALTGLVGLVLIIRYKAADRIRPVEAMFLVTSAWLVVMVFGAIPYVMFGMDVLDALFETMSGFTTTGATIMTNIESWPKSLLFWRSLTHWLGGAGIIMIFVTILPMLGVGGRNLTKNEMPGGIDVQSFSLRIKDEVSKFHVIYLGLSGLCLLLLLLTGIGVYDSLTVTFSTISTGGFAPHAESIAYYDNAFVEWIVVLFMFLASTSFYLHYRAVTTRKLNTYWKSGEFRAYLVIVIASVVLMMAAIWDGSLDTFGTQFRAASFQVMSIMSSTGFTTVDFLFWDRAAIFLLFVLMVIGGMTGSTSGGVKVARFLLSGQFIRSVLYKAVHPRALFSIKLDGRPLREEAVTSLIAVIFCYFMTAIISSVALMLMGMDPLVSASAVITTLSNCGPGIGEFGPAGSFGSLPGLGKVILIFDMWAGRLEFISVLVVLTPVFWTELLRYRGGR